MSREDAEKRLETLAHEIADALEWKLESPRRDYGHYIRIDGPGEEKLGLRIDKDMLEVSGVFPNRGTEVYYLPSGETWPKIKASLWKKTGAQIARDIEKRLWPDYERLLEKALKDIDETAAHRRGSMNLAEKLAKIVGAKVETKEGSYESTINLYRSEALPEFTGDVRVSKDSVRLDHWYLSAEEAEAVFKTLVSIRRKI